MRIQKLIGFGAMLAAGALVLSGCASSSTEQPNTSPDDATGAWVIDGEVIADEALMDAARGGSVKMASFALPEMEEVFSAAVKNEAGINIEFTRATTAQLVERVLSEHGAGQLGFDIVRLSDATAADLIAEQDIFVEYQTPGFEQLEEDGSVLSDGKFYSGFYLPMGIGYNSALVEVEISKWEDLLDPSLNGKLGIVNAVGSGNNLALNDMFIERLGVEYLEGLAAQQPVIFESIAVQRDALGRGEIAAGPMDLLNILAMQESGAPVEFVAPEEGVSASYSPLGLTYVGEGNPAAQVVMNYYLSKAGQLVVGENGFLPSRSDIGSFNAGGYSLPTPGDDQLDIFTTEDRSSRQTDVESTWASIFTY